MLDEHALPGFNDAIQTYFDAMMRVNDVIMQLTALALGLPRATAPSFSRVDEALSEVPKNSWESRSLAAWLVAALAAVAACPRALSSA